MITLQAFDDAFNAQNGHHTVKVAPISPDGIPTFAAQRQNILDILLEYLARVRQFRNIDFVARYIQHTDDENQRLKQHLVSALRGVRNSPSKEQINYALAPWFSPEYHPTPGRPMKCRDIDEIERRLARFDGVGDARSLPRRLTVNIWPYHGPGHCGHAALSLTTPLRQDYFSYWPEGELPASNKQRYLGPRPAQRAPHYEQDTYDSLSEATRQKLTLARVLQELTPRNEIGEMLLERVAERLEDIAKYINLDRRDCDENDIFMFKSLLKSIPLKPVNYVMTSAQQARQRYGDDFLINTDDLLFQAIVNVLSDEQLHAEQLDRTAFRRRIVDRLRTMPSFSSHLQNTIRQADRLAGFQPRSRQIWDEDNDAFVTTADQIYLPLTGPQSDMFGLDEQALADFWQSIQENIAAGEARFQLVSTQHNCSAMALRSLRAAGAGWFVPLPSRWLLYTPRDVEHYALTLQEIIDRLNRQNSAIQIFYQQEVLNPLSEPLLQQIDADLSALTRQYSLTLSQLSAPQRKRLRALTRAVNALPGACQSQQPGRLISAAKTLVEVLFPLLADNANLQQNDRAVLSLAAAMCASRQLRRQGGDLSSAGCPTALTATQSDHHRGAYAGKYAAHDSRSR